MMTREMLISTVEGQECRIAQVHDGTLEELYVERLASASRVGNIYKARVTNVEPSIQAAFVDFGGGKNGFLHISDLHPQYFPGSKRGPEPVGRKRPQRNRPPIQECLRRGQEIVAQMTKEGIGTKGPTLTTYFSIPGRLLVMMPGMSRMGVSRKIEDEAIRAKARKILEELTLPEDIGFILRTAGLGRSKRDLQRDLNYLLRLWKAISQQIRHSKAPAEVYQESDLVVRTIRDVYSTDIDRIVCDRKADALKVKEFLDMAMPRTKYTIEYYTGKDGLFHDYGLEDELEKIHSRRVELPSGGSLVIDQTEALVAIDVNSGRFRDHSNAEMTALKTNQEAAGEIARQLRLRDMGGVIVIDFIDMWEDRHRRAVEKALREAIKPDRAKTKLLRISPLGILEMTRQRVRPSLQASVYASCPHCNGTGMIKSEESVALTIMRDVGRAVANDEIANIEVKAQPAVAQHLSNYYRAEIAEMESQSGKRILLTGDADLAGGEFRFACLNRRNSPVAWQPQPGPTKAKGKPNTVNIEQIVEEQKQAQQAAAAPKEEPAKLEPAAEQPAQESPAAKKRRRGRRGGRRHKKKASQASPGDETKADQPQAETPQEKPAPAEHAAGKRGEEAPQPAPAKKKRRRRPRKRAKKTPTQDNPAGGNNPAPNASPPAETPGTSG